MVYAQNCMVQGMNDVYMYLFIFYPSINNWLHCCIILAHLSSLLNKILINQIVDKSMILEI